MSKSFERDQNLYEKCVLYNQVHSGEDVKFCQKNKTYRNWNKSGSGGYRNLQIWVYETEEQMSADVL